MVVQAKVFCLIEMESEGIREMNRMASMWVLSLEIKKESSPCIFDSLVDKDG